MTDEDTLSQQITHIAHDIIDMESNYKSLCRMLDKEQESVLYANRLLREIYEQQEPSSYKFQELERLHAMNRSHQHFYSQLTEGLQQEKRRKLRELEETHDRLRKERWKKDTWD